MKKTRILAISPVPECIYLAAQHRSEWDELHIAGRKLIARRLQEWKRKPDIGEILIMVPDIENGKEVRHSLKELEEIKVRWFSRTPSVTKACEGLKHVRCVEPDVMADGVSSKFPSHKSKQPSDKPDLLDYVRYKITLALMRSLDPDPLKQAVDVIAKHFGKTFDLADIVPDDIKSIEYMRDADFPYLEGQSEKIAALKSRIRQVAPSDISVLIIGETGTGKEAAAFYLHEFSKRRSKPFVSINCAGLQEEFLRSELFGHVKGAYTGAAGSRAGLVEKAEGGTLFLDELGDMPVAIQADLLRFLQTRRYRRMGEDHEKKADIRVIAAAQRDIRRKLESKEVRKDLFYRIAEVEIETPSLAEVPDDLIRIVRNIAYRLKDDPHIVEDTIAYFEKRQGVLRNYPWPGNVRELARCVKQRLNLGYDVVKDLDSHQCGSEEMPEQVTITGPNSIRPVDEIVTQYVRRAYENRGSMTQAEVALRLGIAVNTLKKHLAGPDA